MSSARRYAAVRASFRRRRLGSRGTAALEFAMVMPVFLAVIGICLVVGLGSMARMQMMSLAHQASRLCAIDPAFNSHNVASCIGPKVNQLASQPYAFIKVCQLAPAVVSGPDVISAANAPAPVFWLRTTLQCSYSLGTTFVRLVPNAGPSVITLAATASTPYLPRLVP